MKRLFPSESQKQFSDLMKRTQELNEELTKKEDYDVKDKDKSTMGSRMAGLE